MRGAQTLNAGEGVIVVPGISKYWLEFFRINIKLRYKVKIECNAFFQIILNI